MARASIVLGAVCLFVACGREPVDAPPLPVLEWSEWHSPSPGSRPWVRWWWPGNDVVPAELTRELELLAEAGFGGAEIQAFNAALSPDADADEMARRLSVDTAEYYAHVAEALDRAENLGMAVDLTLGSGWPTARTDIPPSQSMQMLVWGEAEVQGGGERTVSVPPPEQPAFYQVADMAAAFGEPMAEWLPEHALLVAVVAARVTGGERNANPLVLDDTLELDVDSVQVLTDAVEGDAVTFSAGPGMWRVIAFYRMPDGQYPSLPALPDAARVINHLDGGVVEESLAHYLGERTGKVTSHAALRGFFVDSFELKNERLFTDDFLAEFEARRGYDATPYLPAVVVPGADNHIFDGAGLRRRSPFSLGDFDERVRFDYAHTVSDLFLERFVEKASLYSQTSFRIQPYGVDVDLVRAAGLADIPEAEQLYAGGTELFLRLIASGAHLQGREVISAETLVWADRTAMTTPTRIRAAVDKLFAAGVNQVVYHGFPYRKAEGYGETGWHPFCSPFSGMGTFTSNVGEASPFWPFMKRLNQYVARVQSFLRQGHPANGVLVYYPFLGASASLLRMEEHDELFFNGHFPGDEGGSGANPLFALVDSLFGEKDPPASAAWLEQAWPALRSLDAAGHTWDFISDDAAAESMGLKDGTLHVNLVGYRGILLFQVPHMSPEVAERIADAAEAGFPVVVVGDPPRRQPGFLDHDSGDARVQAAMERVLAAASTIALNDATSVPDDATSVPDDATSVPDDAGAAMSLAGAVPFLPGLAGEGVRFQVRVSVVEPFAEVQYSSQDMEGHLAEQEPPPFALHAFLFNPAPEPRFVAFDWPAGCTSGFWLDAWSDGWWPADEVDSRVEAELPALGSLFFVCNYAPPEADAPGPSLRPPYPTPNSTEAVGPWRLSVTGDDVAGGAFDELLDGLPDWRDVEALRYCSSEGTYSVQVEVPATEGTRWALRAESVRGAAEVSVNGSSAGTLLVPPYRVEVTALLMPGTNDITIRLVPPLRNRLVGLGQTGDPSYPQFVTDPERLAPTGLVGAVYVDRYDPPMP